MGCSLNRERLYSLLHFPVKRKPHRPLPSVAVSNSLAIHKQRKLVIASALDTGNQVGPFGNLNYLAEKYLFSYFAFEPPYLTYHRVDADGRLVQTEPIEIPNMVMMHDFNVTRNHVVFMDLPLTFKLEAVGDGALPFRFDRDAGARLGVMPRDGSNSDVVWYEIDPCYVFHPVNSHEEGDNLVLHVARLESAFGESADDYSASGCLWRWTIDPIAGTVKEEQLDDRAGDFGRIDDRLVGLPARYGYLMSLPDTRRDYVEYGETLYKYDLTTGQRWDHELGSGVKGGEPVCAPAGPWASDASTSDAVSYTHLRAHETLR